jgi:hypothetical protein
VEKSIFFNFSIAPPERVSLLKSETTSSTKTASRSFKMTAGFSAPAFPNRASFKQTTLLKPMLREIGGKTALEKDKMNESIYAHQANLMNILQVSKIN